MLVYMVMEEFLYTFTCKVHIYPYKCKRIVYIMVQTRKCMGNVHKMAQAHKN